MKRTIIEVSGQPSLFNLNVADRGRVDQDPAAEEIAALVGDLIAVSYIDWDIPTYEGNGHD